MTQITNTTKAIRVVNATAAGTSTPVNGTTVDTAGFEGVRFIVSLGATLATATAAVKVQQGAQSNLSDAADVTGSSYSIVPTTDDNSVVIVDVYRPSKRYVRVVVTRGVANTTIDGAVAELYEGQLYPYAQDATVHSTIKLVSP